MSYSTAPCPAYTTPSYTTPQFDNKIDCNFDTNTICDWTDDPTSAFKWIVWASVTPTALTGPSNDHTTNSIMGRYIFLSAAAPHQFNQTARIASPLLNAGSYGSGGCFSFYYHMFGSDSGRLNVYRQLTNSFSLSDEDDNGKPIWQRHGNHGNQWRHAQVFMPGTPVNKTRFIIEGVVS